MAPLVKVRENLSYYGKIYILIICYLNMHDQSFKKKGLYRITSKLFEDGGKY